MPIPSLLDASLRLFLDPGMIRYGIDLLHERYGREWTVLDGREQTGSVRVRITPHAPSGVVPEWVLVTLQHDDRRRMVAHLSYGETALLRVPDGHFQILAFFLGPKRFKTHKPPLLAIAQTYRGLFIGKQRVLDLYGRVPGPADIATLLASGSEELLPIALPQEAHSSPAGRPLPLQLPPKPSGMRPSARVRTRTGGSAALRADPVTRKAGQSEPIRPAWKPAAGFAAELLAAAPPPTGRTELTPRRPDPNSKPVWPAPSGELIRGRVGRRGTYEEWIRRRRADLNVETPRRSGNP